MKKSTTLFISAGVAVVLGIIATSIGFATARTEAELTAVAHGSGFWWVILGAIIIAVYGFILRRKGE